VSGPVAPPASVAALSRRRETGAASARSLLLTVLGEFVLPRRSPVWTGVLVGSLAALGVEEKAARQALSRTAAEGLIVASREGRRVRWSLSPEGTRLLAAGAERIHGFLREVPQWDGEWLVLAVTVPETQRQLRHRLRTRLTWAGFGSPLPGLWVSPDTGKEQEAAAVVAELGVDAFSYVGRSGPVGEELRVVAQAWDLDGLAAEYSGFLGGFTAQDPGTAREAFVAQVRLVQAWRRFPSLDPALPVPLLPQGWPGHEAAAVFQARHEAWHRSAQQHWDELCGAAAGRL